MSREFFYLQKGGKASPIPPSLFQFVTKNGKFFVKTKNAPRVSRCIIKDIFLDTQVSLEPTHVQYNLAEQNITLLNRI